MAGIEEQGALSPPCGGDKLERTYCAVLCSQYDQKLSSELSHTKLATQPARLAAGLHPDSTGFGTGRMPAHAGTLN